MSELALLGGTPTRNVETDPWTRWPTFDEREEQGLIEVLRSGIWSYNGPKEQEFCREFAAFIGSRYALCAANGTVTLQLALEACQVGLGDEVIVPGLTWQATAASVLDVNATPILVDVCEDTWCIDPNEIEQAISPRTKAIIPVHLYGSFADMNAIMEIAKRHRLFVIEDCAHKHGAEWNGRKAGSIGDIGSFSFQLSKLMTAGEGGALTTSSPHLFARLDALRNCGRRPEGVEDYEKGAGIYGSEGNFVQSGNYRITDFQAALLLESLRRLPQQNLLRDQNAKYLNQLLAEIPGIAPMHRDDRETLEAYYNIAFRFHSEAFKGLGVQTFRSALQAELGSTVEGCYEPLNRCELYTPQTKPSRHRLSAEYWEAIAPAMFKLPNCERAYDNESVCLHFAILMGPRSDMEQIADAIKKIHRHAEDLT
ncbi:MAG: DegT/DnrJ/EryC1/StrS family aminotransferase [Acidobacteriota bacterium]|nr:MAG: DegT/DnrJ/EryC1/StrS family aminotransferase [Acidobacteriota bacterium]